ncbi:MAG: DUF1549 and DUF1553 domain-containing protein [Verrucomicrobiota bacterium]|jgi:hypothetical protein|nr:DUF1549 and DUF1553 domain-containing protein [Verrucomicrobiota bacterium]
MRPGRWIVLLTGLALDQEFGRAEDQYTIVESPITAEERNHWAWQPLGQVAVPRVPQARRLANPIDYFIAARLHPHRLGQAPEADRRTLIRRLYFDLLGLPPSAEDVTTFEADPRPDAYERLLDSLLASPAYGERWAQHWLDLARFAETDGFEHDKVRPNAWRYRDWLINALNIDLPYDQFVLHQLAGDTLSPPDALATGFLLAGQDMPDINLNAERRHMVLNEMTATVGSVFLGLNIGCAQCHDHKSDPISQVDFYQLRAYFEGGLTFSEQELGEGRGKGRVMAEADKPVSTLFPVRGDFRRLGPVVQPAVPRIARGKKTAVAVTNRAGLAHWMSKPGNPLFRRTIANRLWQFHFGQPLTAIPSDLGRTGERPTHPALLDWLAAELPRRYWSLKAIHRLLLTSATYRQASRGVGEKWVRRLAADRENRLYSRMNRRRLDGETLRDTLLAISGQATQRAGGPGVRPALPREITSTLLNNQWPVSKSVEDHHRRSVYLFARRNLRYPLFELFDRPDGTASCSRRKESTTAPQSLILLNSDFSLASARALAKRLAKLDQPTAVHELYSRLFQRRPSESELRLAKRFLVEQEPHGLDPIARLALALINLNEFLFLD